MNQQKQRNDDQNINCPDYNFEVWICNHIRFVESKIVVSMIWTIVFLLSFKIQIFKLSPVFKIPSWSFWSLGHWFIMGVGFFLISMISETITSHSKPLVFNVSIWKVLQEFSKHVIRSVYHCQREQFLEWSKYDHCRHNWLGCYSICNCDESHWWNDKNVWSYTESFHSSIFVRRIAIFHSI